MGKIYTQVLPKWSHIAKHNTGKNYIVTKIVKGKATMMIDIGYYKRMIVEMWKTMWITHEIVDNSWYATRRARPLFLCRIIFIM